MRRMHSLRTSPGQVDAAHTKSSLRAARSLWSLRSWIDLSLAVKHSAMVGSAARTGVTIPNNAALAKTKREVALGKRFMVTLVEALGFEVFLPLCVEVVVGVAVGFRFCGGRGCFGRRCRGRLLRGIG